MADLTLVTHLEIKDWRWCALGPIFDLGEVALISSTNDRTTGPSGMGKGGIFCINGIHGGILEEATATGVLGGM